MSVVCDLPVKCLEVHLPDGTYLACGVCPLCGFTPERMVVGNRPKVMGRFLLPGHEVSEEESERQLDLPEIKSWCEAIK